LSQLAQAKENVNKINAVNTKVSEIVGLLQQYDLPMLILIAVRSSRPLRHEIWRYLTVWSRIEPILDGNDLKKLGYKPGPQYRQMLNDLRDATLDGVISDHAQAKEFLAKRYPLSQ
jgi:tRNA nucleotidyltransferase (CCA-adding enzyme)